MSRFDLTRTPESSTLHTAGDDRGRAPGTAWAQHELQWFCESMLEEYEEELVALLATEAIGSASLPRVVCQQKLTLCMPSRRVRSHPPSRAMARRTERLHAAHAALDKDRDGVLSHDELAQWIDAMNSRGDARGARARDSLDVAMVFARLDTNRDTTVSLREYMALPANGDASAALGRREGEHSGEQLAPNYWDAETPAGVPFDLVQELLRLVRPMTDLPLVALPVVVVCVYIGGLVFRFW